ncbi:MAG: helix-turn-helix transcriptional regulator [Candidatus Omnitrophota bacterium]
MRENIFWDKRISRDKIKDILKDGENPRFVEFAALLLSRTNLPKMVFENYLEKEVFCKNWRRIKLQMRKDKWKDERIIFWDEIYKVLREKIKIEVSPEKREAVSPEIKAVGEQIRLARKSKGLTQAELSKESGLSQQLISYIENGYLNISFETLMKIVEVLDIEIIVRKAS